MKKRVDKHRPLHINQTSNPYFVTGRTYFGLPYFNTKEEKKTLLKAIKLACKNYCLSLDGWVILDNHYHLLFRPPGCCWELGIADKSARPKRSIADKSARPREISIANKSARPREISIANKSARPVPKRSSNFSCDQVIKDFKIGKVMGTIHGKSSSLLKKIADKSARPEERNSKLACDGTYSDWWQAKYWEQIKNRNVKLYGQRSQLAEERRRRKFISLLKNGTPRQIVEFVTSLDKIWYQYRDWTIRNEEDFYKHLNYIHQNPVKHGLVKKMSGYKWSSLGEYLEVKGEEWVIDCFRQYPVVDFEPVVDFD